MDNQPTDNWPMSYQCISVFRYYHMIDIISALIRCLRTALYKPNSELIQA